MNLNEEITLDTLLEHHHVTITAVYNCAETHFDYLSDMENIFELKTEEDAKLLVTIPELFFTKPESESIIAYFRKEEGSEYLAAIKPDIEKHKVLLLSAFVYNPSFFSMAWNWCAYIQDKVRKEQSNPGLRLVKSEGATNPTIENDGTVIVFVWNTPLEIDRKVAASSGNLAFGETIMLEGIGELRQLAEEAEGHIHFQFSLTITNEQLTRPFALEIQFSTLKDGKVHAVEITDNPDKPKQVIRSKPCDNIDASLGIAIHRIEFKPMQSHE